jgi:hypothetical protein
MSKEKKLKEKKKKKPSNTDPLPEPAPIPGLPVNETNQDPNRDDKQRPRIPVPPGEMPPLPIYAPTEPGHEAPMYV